MVAVSQGHAGREAKQQPALTAAPPQPSALASYTLSSTFPAMRTHQLCWNTCLVVSSNQHCWVAMVVRASGLTVRSRLYVLPSRSLPQLRSLTVSTTAPPISFIVNPINYCAMMPSRRLCYALMVKSDRHIVRWGKIVLRKMFVLAQTPNIFLLA